MQGPTFVYVVSNRWFYKISVKYFNSGKYTCSRDVFISVASFHGYKYICLTRVKKCYKKLYTMLISFKKISMKIVYLIVWNHFTDYRELLYQKILFEKGAILIKGQTPKTRRNFGYFQIDSVDTNDNVLPRPAGINAKKEA